MIETRDPFEPFTLWFRSLSRVMQWVLGVPIIILGTMRFWHDITYVPQPGEPIKAFWVTLILFVVSIVLNELLRPKLAIEQARPKGLGDFQFPTATEGRVVPIIWGRVRQKGPNVTWYGDLFQETITEKVKTGIWSSERITKGFRYHLGVQMVICRGGTAAAGDTVALRKVWVGDDLLSIGGPHSTNTRFDIDDSELFGGDDLGSGGLKATVDFYVGDDTQASNAYLDDPARQQITVSGGTSTCPAYYGNSYVVLRELTSAAPAATDIGAYMGNSTSIKSWSFEVERFPALFSGQTAGENKVGSNGDCNPMNAVYEILTNKEWGFGEDASQLDIGGGSSFLRASDTMIAEGNGFSLLLDQQMPAKDLLNELQRQIDGVIYINQATGKWTVQLAREAAHTHFGYNIDTIPQLTDSNVAEVRDYTRGAWEDTTNTITVKYSKRDDDYKESYALAQDQANAMLQGDGTVTNAQAVSGALSFPGVKDSALAAQIAWRELKGQSYPLGRCTLIVDRSEYYSAANSVLSIGGVVAWTNAQLGFTKLAMRITEVDYGKLQSNKIRLNVVQDVFSFTTASMGAPAATQWTQPSLSAAVFTNEIAFSAPRAIIVRNPDYASIEDTGKVWCGAARVGSEVAFDIHQQNAAGGAPSGSYSFDDTIVQFMEVGVMNAALPAGESNPATAVVIKPDASSQTKLVNAFTAGATLTDLGQDLVHLIMVGEEFMLVESAQTSGGNVQLNNVYRGALDSGQNTHAADDKVYLLFAGGGLTAASFTSDRFVDVKLLGRTYNDTLTIGSATEIQTDLAERAIRPYPPAAILPNVGGADYETPDLEDTTTGGENGQRFQVDLWGRAYNNTDEIVELLADTDPDTGGASATEYRVRVFVDPLGSPVEIVTGSAVWQAHGVVFQVSRNEILDKSATLGVDDTIRIQVDARHTYNSVVYASANTTQFDTTMVSVNTGLFFLGGSISNGISNAYTVANADTHTIRLGAAMTLANAQYRVNGGSWITITGTSQVTASLSVSDTIEVWVDSGTHAPDPNFVYIEEDTGVVRVAYGTL